MPAAAKQDSRVELMQQLMQGTPEERRQMLSITAHALQTALVETPLEVVPHARALEVLMRAVAHSIDGDSPHYVQQKLDIGYRQLVAELS